MKKLTTFCSLIFALALVFASSASASTNNVALLSPELIALKGACQVLVNKPQSRDALDVLFQYAKNTNSVDRLRSRAMAGFALSALFDGDTNLFFRAQESHARIYPDDKNLLRTDLRSCYSVCEECQGAGTELVDCYRCQGQGICPTCRGKGFALVRKNLRGTKEAGVSCSTCNGSGKCPRCGGAKREIQSCSKCKGRAAPFQPSQVIYQDFVMIIKGIIKWIDNEEVFYERYQLAKDEPDDKQKRFLLSALIDDYNYRPEIYEAKLLLDKVLDKLRGQSQAENAEAERAKKEVNTLKALLKSEHLSGAIATLQDYLEKNPDSEHRVELVNIQNQLVDKLKEQRRRRHLLYIAGGIFLALFGLSCIQINHYKYTIFSRGRELEE